ncbi:MAG: hypothetical protein HPY50_04705 [Firmicutes bacterium]|nr:hypothetical protein [Bacillota bacterium]
MAYDSYNPQFDILRGRTEQEFSKAREQAPQMVAAKYGGVSALRGGRMKSQEAQLTQKEAQAIQDLESQRLATINQAARDIQTKTNTAQAENWYKQQELKQRQREAAAAERNRQALSNMQRENDYLRQVLRLLGVEV